MKSSFIDKVFPKATFSPILPQYHREEPRRTASPSTPSPLLSRPSSSPSQSHRNSPLSPTPLSASVIHHADPFLSVDRAAKALQKIIQSMLNAQSDALVSGLGAGSRDDISSTSSLTPTPSVSTPPRSNVGLKTTPVRQPAPRKISLRGARKGLTKSMQDFVLLKEEELRILDSQTQGRSAALRKVQDMESKRSGLKGQVDTIKSEGTSRTAQRLQKEALELDGEIKELEDKLFELKARKRHILEQASQIENSVGSKLSSYTSSLALVDQEIKQFLNRPPVHSALSTMNPVMSESMYDLKAERRTLEMAKEQWTNERNFLDEKKLEAVTEKRALEEGSLMWRETLLRINAFEKELRTATKGLSQLQSNIRSPSSTDPADHSASMFSLLPSLDSTISFLETNLHAAEMNKWNLLICCIGAETEAFQQGRVLLLQTLGLPMEEPQASSSEGQEDPRGDLGGNELDNPPPRSPSVESNKSLDDTMKAFGNPRPHVEDEKGEGVVRNGIDDEKPDTDASFGFGPTNGDSESEEDDPGPDFFLTR